MIIMLRRILLALVVAAVGCTGNGAPPSSVEDGTAAADGETPAAVEPAGSDSATEATAPDTDGPVVVFLGTSLTAGLGLGNPEQQAWPAQLDHIADSAGHPIRAVDAGVSGETSAGGLRRLDWVLRDPLDILVVELGANDGLRGQDPAALENNLLAIVRRTRSRYPAARILIAGMQAPPNLGPEYTGAFARVFPDVADSTHSALVPFLLQGVAGIPELNQEDGIHPTPEGHRIMAETVWPYLRPLVEAVEAEASAAGTPAQTPVDSTAGAGS
jgi:acyl-CoA thioesterase-1